MTVNDSNSWEPRAFLQFLRPEPDQTIDCALLASYSCDLIVLTAILLALSGHDGEAESASKVNVADALDGLDGYVAVVHQQGRIPVPPANNPVLKVLDKFMRPIEAGDAASWHPKLALVRYKSSQQPERKDWRLWIGSRNFTRPNSWEIGLHLRSSNYGQRIVGIAELGKYLASIAKLPGIVPDKTGAELQSVLWDAGKGIQVKSLNLWGLSESRQLPQAPADLTELIVISPFLDGSIVRHLSTWGTSKTNRILISTLPTLQKLSQQTSKPLDGFGKNVRFLASPDDDLVVPVEPDGASEAEVDFGGLHAKLIAAHGAKGWEAWIGSANATQRGLRGPNAEVVAHVIMHSQIAEGIRQFVDSEAVEVRAVDLSATRSPAKSTDFERGCESLAANWNLRQRKTSTGMLLSGDSVPHLFIPEAEICVAQLGSVPTMWPPDSKSLLLPVNQRHETEFVTITVQRKDEKRSWVQVATIETFDRDARDGAIIREYLGPRNFLSWIRSLLDGVETEGGGRWDDFEHHSPKKNVKERFVSLSPSLEQMMKAYIGDAGQLHRVDRLLREYVRHFELEQSDCLNELRELQEVWPIIRKQLLSRKARAGK